MAYDLTTLADYAWADIAKAAKVAMVTTALGGNQLTINGRTVARVTLKEATDLYDFALAQVAAEQGGFSGGGNILVDFNR